MEKIKVSLKQLIEKKLAKDGKKQPQRIFISKVLGAILHLTIQQTLQELNILKR